MKTHTTIGALLGALCIAGATVPTTAADSFTEALKTGKVSLNARLRYEFAEQDGLDNANASTIRTRLGYTTADLSGFAAMFEAENVAAFDGDAYNQAGLNPGGAGQVVVADPETTEVNQAWLSYSGQHFTAKGGRQRIVLDNARFVGDVGWRQNMQTFDSATIAAHPVDALAVTYGYLWRINRIFGDEHPAGVWDSDSHILNGRLTVSQDIALTGYAYLLDFDNAAANSSATYGISLTGKYKLGGANSGRKLDYRAEYARQNDYGNQPLEYGADFYAAELGYSDKTLNGGIGYEVLGSDSGLKGFATPLATLHAFEGWADVFLGTPANGVKDAYAWIGASLPWKLSAKVYLHDFRPDAGSTAYGREWDVLLARKFGDNWSALLKAADFNGEGTFADVRKFWAQVEFAF